LAKKEGEGMAPLLISLTVQEKKVLGFLFLLALLGGGALAYRALFEREETSPPRRVLNAVPTLVERNSP
jgi:hypothetical protein